MNSGKTLELLHRVERLNFLPDCSFNFFKPSTDTRDPIIRSRWGNDRTYECTFINPALPESILSLCEGLDLVVIDEAQFFSERIVEVVLNLLRKNINVIAAGLDLDFRGEPFGSMHKLMSIATDIHKLSGICQFQGCGKDATRTQRLVDGLPASYDSPIILVGDKKEGYECRCLAHHDVPGHPQKKLFNYPISAENH